MPSDETTYNQDTNYMTSVWNFAHAFDVLLGYTFNFAKYKRRQIGVCRAVLL